ncbi:MAG TPA: C-GCAxxG-C-C family protein [Limnochordia bacterium]|nr:C-GCAxxG-C-C family protein [Limnochordia bacterium]
MSKKLEEALELFSGGFNCAQATLGPFVEMEKEGGRLALKLASSFGGGMRTGGVCGAVTGALMVIGAREGQCLADDQAAKERCSKLTLHFMDEYAKRKGTLLCREILGYDVRDAEAAKKFAACKGQKCADAIRTAIKLLEEMEIE